MRSSNSTKLWGRWREPWGRTARARSRRSRWIETRLEPKLSNSDVMNIWSVSKHTFSRLSGTSDEAQDHQDDWNHSLEHFCFSSVWRQLFYWALCQAGDEGKSRSKSANIYVRCRARQIGIQPSPRLFDNRDSVPNESPFYLCLHSDWTCAKQVQYLWVMLSYQR